MKNEHRWNLVVGGIVRYSMKSERGALGALRRLRASAPEADAYVTHVVHTGLRWEVVEVKR